MGFWAFFKAVAKFGFATVTGYEVAQVFQGESAATEVQKEFQALKNDVKSMVDQLKSSFDFTDVKTILIIVFAMFWIMMFFLVAAKMYNIVHKTGKKSGQRTLNE